MYSGIILTKEQKIQGSYYTNNMEVGQEIHQLGYMYSYVCFLTMLDKKEVTTSSNIMMHKIVTTVWYTNLNLSLIRPSIWHY